MPVALVYLCRYVYCVFVYVQYVQHVRRMNDAVVCRCTGCSHKSYVAVRSRTTSFIVLLDVLSCSLGEGARAAFVAILQSAVCSLQAAFAIIRSSGHGPQLVLYLVQCTVYNVPCSHVLATAVVAIALAVDF